MMVCRLLLMALLWGNYTVAAYAQYQVRVINHIEGLKSTIPLTTLQDIHGLTWIVTYDGLYKFDGYRATKIQVRGCDTCAVSNDFILGMVALQNGDLWMLTAQGIGKFNPVSGVFSLQKEVPNQIWCRTMFKISDSLLIIMGCGINSLAYHIPSGRLYTYTQPVLMGLNHIVQKEKVAESVFYQEYPALWPYLKTDSLQKERFWYKKKNGTLWTIDTTGIHYFTKGSLQYSTISLPYQQLSVHNIVNVRLDSKEYLWLCVRGMGVVILNTDINTFGNVTGGADNRGLVKPYVLGIFPAGKDSIVVYPQFTKFGPATLVNTKTKSTQIIKGSSMQYRIQQELALPALGSRHAFDRLYQSLDANNKNRLLEGNFFAGSGKQHVYLSDIGNHLNLWPSGKRLLNQVINICHMYRPNGIWMGTESHGLLHIQPDAGRVTIFKPSVYKKNTYASWTVFGMVADGMDNCWLATSAGLWYFDRSKRRFRGWNEVHGLAHQIVYNIVKDKAGRLWLGTGNGLSCFDPVSEKFTNYYKADGLINTEYNRNSAFITSDGCVWMGGADGIDFFKPDSIGLPAFTAMPIIAEVQCDDVRLNHYKPLKLSGHQNSLTVMLGINEPLRALRYQFAWLLEGSEDKWNMLGESRVLSLANLAANEYTLRVRLLDANGAVAKQEATLKFSIAPFWYQTWFFRIGILLLLGTLLAWIFAYRHRQKISRLKQENEIYRLRAAQEDLIYRERERITADLHDDAGATLSSLYLYSDLAERVLEHKPSDSKDLLIRIRDTSKDLMQRMNDIIWSLKPAIEEKNSLKLRIMNYCQEIFDRMDIKVHYAINEELDTSITHPLVRKHIWLVCKEALNNVAKYSKASQVWIGLNCENNLIVLEIKDNGTGIKQGVANAGNGLQHMQQRITQLAGTWKLDTSVDAGVRITCSIPVNSLTQKAAPPTEKRSG